MDFSWGREHKALRREVVSFARELNAGLAEREAAASFPRDLWLRCGEFKLQGLPVPEQLGGRGLDPLSTALALEALGYGCRDAGLVFSLGAHLLSCVVPVWKFGNEQQQQRYLPDLCSGHKVGSLAMTEPNAGSDVYSLRTRAEPDGDGWRLEGSKTLITNATVADLLIVSAVTDPEKGAHGVSAFLIEAGAPGLEIGGAFGKMGQKTSPLGSVFLHDVRVGPDALLGTLGGGSNVFQEAMDWERICLFASHLGATEWLLEAATGHVRRRQRASTEHRKAAEGGEQAAAHRIADIKVQVEAAKLLVYQAAWQLGRGRSASLHAAMVKLFVSEGLVDAAGEVWKIFGRDPDPAISEIGRVVCDAAGTTLYSGTSEIQRNIIASMLGL